MITNKTENWISRFIEQESLPASFCDTIRVHYQPLASTVAKWRADSDGPLVLGVNGAQGTGKSTLAAVLAGLLSVEYGLRSAILSIDDLYLTKAERNQLAADIHPLLATRGVPGTHDVALGVDAITALKQGQPATLPRFDKSIDDRAPKTDWEAITPPVDVIILEGWCVGAVPQDQSELSESVNTLEATEDPTGTWRGMVNDSLSTGYTELFGLLDHLIMLKAPNFECVHDWRGEQERKLRDRVLAAGQTDLSGVMDTAALSRFIMHYERLTSHMLTEMPDRADEVLFLERDHSIRDAARRS